MPDTNLFLSMKVLGFAHTNLRKVGRASSDAKDRHVHRTAAVVLYIAVRSDTGLLLICFLTFIPHAFCREARFKKSTWSRTAPNTALPFLRTISTPLICL